ncbi:peptidoglycan-binding domain-containing protein [uncultured Abyssibacter sp.]|uniref:peptidoglycan-binding domain-containing protein n=1 Tax=uncultured Abyssibacter sp. TaxID=2320202 RepID=UPI0032B20CFB
MGRQSKTTRETKRLAGVLVVAMLAGCQTTDPWGTDVGEWSDAEPGYPTYLTAREYEDRQRATNGVPPPPLRQPANPLTALERRAFPNEVVTDAPAFEVQSYARQQEQLTAQRLAEQSAIRAREARRESFFDRHLAGQPASMARATMPTTTQTTQPVAYRRSDIVRQPLQMADAAPATSILPSADQADRYSVTGIPPMPAARAGECYALVRKPAEYRTVRRQVETASGYEKLVTQPAQVVTESRPVVVREAYEEMRSVPAQFRDVTERVLVRPARMVWKPGRGPVERIDHATGEIMCLVEEPAQYRTVTRRVMVKPAEVQRVHVPAEVRNVPVQRVVQPSQTQRVSVPPQYGTVETEELVQAARLEWRPVLCETNMNRDTIRRLQQALKARGFEPGPVDGVIGRRTMEAVNAYQRANGLPVDRYLNLETVRSLGVG